MKRLLIYMIMLCTLFVAGCEKPQPLPAGSFYVGDGIVNNTLTLKGYEGSSSQFYISSKYPWSIESGQGFVCEPSSGLAGENICITVTPQTTNNSLDYVDLGALNFRVEKTRFVGVTVRQESAVKVMMGEFSDTITLGAAQGSSATMRFSSLLFGDELPVVSQGDVEVVTSVVDGDTFSVKVKSLVDNLTSEQVKIGEFYLDISGDYPNTKIAVWQSPAMTLEQGEVLINGTVGSEYLLSVNTPFKVNASTTSSDFTVTAEDDSLFTITATSENGTLSRRLLGKVSLALEDNPDCKSEIEVWQRPATAPHAILCYCMGVGLKSFFETNVSMMKQALADGVQGDKRVLIFQQSNSTTGQIVELVYDQTMNRVDEHVVVSRVNLPAKYNSEMLAGVLQSMVNAAPAASYSLLFGSHGKGWIPKTETLMRTTFGVSYDDIWKPVAGALPTRHMGDASATQLNIVEFVAACDKVGKKFDYILFDQCFASNVEMLYDMRNVAEYILASPCEVMADGFPYADIMPLLLADGDKRSMLDSVAKAYVDFYLNNRTGNSVSACAAVAVCSELEALAEAVKAANLSDKNEDFALEGVQYYDGISPISNTCHIFYDLESFVMLSCKDSAAVEALRAQLDKTVLSRYHTPSFYSAYNGKLNDIEHYCGLSTSAPIEYDSRSAYVDEWQETAWYKATH